MITFAPREVMRDPVAKLIEYNRRFGGDGRDPAWLRSKLDRLCASPLGFLRGTFHLFADDWPTLGDDPLGPGAAQPIVGDLHLENFGAYKTKDGRYVFDVNDFDETAPGTPALDLGRLATSIVLADDRRSASRSVERIEGLLEAYLKAVTDADLRPIEQKKSLPEPVQEVLARAEAGSRPDWIEARVEGGAGKRRFRKSAKYIPVEDPARRRAVEEGVRQFAAACAERPAECPTWPAVLDAAVRIAGTGSLGRWRYAVLMPGKGEKVGKELVLELKEAIPSSLLPNDPDQAARVIAHQKRLQGASPSYLGTATIDGRLFTVKELQPMEAKLTVAELHSEQLEQLCIACGDALGRAHRRVGSELPERLAGRERALHRRILAFALRYAEIVEEDRGALLKRRTEIEQALGLTVT
jgi:uncharacterized protein (DUF2252 family)